MMASAFQGGVAVVSDIGLNCNAFVLAVRPEKRFPNQNSIIWVGKAVLFVWKRPLRNSQAGEHL